MARFPATQQLVVFVWRRRQRLSQKLDSGGSAGSQRPECPAARSGVKVVGSDRFKSGIVLEGGDVLWSCRRQRSGGHPREVWVTEVGVRQHFRTRCHAVILGSYLRAR